MTQKLRPVSLVILSTFFLFFLGGCVSKNLYLLEVKKRQSLEKQIEKIEILNTRLRRERRGMRTRLNVIQRGDTLKGRQAIALIKLQKERARQNTSLETQEQKMVALQEKLEIDRLSLEEQMDDLKTALFGKDQEVTGLRNKLKVASEETNALETRLAVTEEVAIKKIQDAEEITKTRETLIQNLEQEINSGHVRISQMNDQLSVQIIDKILFSTGSDQINNAGKALLKKLSHSLREMKKKIRIEGHTDNVPIRGLLAGKYPTNWELSTGRATHVVRYLISQGIPPKHLLAVGMAHYSPVASNKTPEGRQENRRIEVVLSPR